MSESEDVKKLGIDISGIDKMVAHVKSDIEKHQNNLNELETRRTEIFQNMSDMEKQINLLGDDIGRIADNADDVVSKVVAEDKKMAEIGNEMKTVKRNLDNAIAYWQQHNQGNAKEFQDCIVEKKKCDSLLMQMDSYTSKTKEAMAPIQAAVKRDVTSQMKAALVPMTTTLETVAEQIAKIKASLQNMFENIGRMEGALPTLKTQFNGLLKVVGSVVPAAVEQINKGVKNMVDFISEMVEAFPSMDEVEESMSAALKQIADALRPMAEHVKKAKESLGPIEEVVNNTVKNVLNPLQKAAIEMQREIASMKSFLKPLLSSVPATVVNSDVVSDAHASSSSQPDAKKDISPDKSTNSKQLQSIPSPKTNKESKEWTTKF